MSKPSTYVVVSVACRTAGQPNHSVAFHDDQLIKADASPQRHERLRMLLDEARVVPDVWRYNVTMRASKVAAMTPLQGHEGARLPRSGYVDMDAAAAVGKRIILLLLESPGDREYEADVDGSTPVVRGPAQGTGGGRTGGAIDAYLRYAINEASFALPDGEYALVIANPVPYNCNLKWLADPSAADKSPLVNMEDAPKRSPANRTTLAALRDYIWTTLWLARFVQDEFAERVNAYAPFAILNCCTGVLRQHVSAFLITMTRFGERIAEGPHPSVQWNVKYAKANCPPSSKSVNNRSAPLKPQAFRPVTVKRLD